MSVPMITGYEIDRKLGSGGMGEVYLAHYFKLDRTVAIKVLASNLSDDPSIRARFQNEAKLMAKLSHPNIVQLYDILEDGQNLALVMEYIEGRTLDTIIGQEVGPIPEEQALPIFRQIADAVNYAHLKGIIHRDLKPANILVTPANHVKITDFGIAKIAGSRNLTRTGTRMGTLFYMSPEQVEGKEVDFSADIYALGMTLYEMLAGKMPLKDHDTSDFAIMESILRKELPDPRTYYPHITEWLVE
ncbi:serine/threonine protein kinase, partial [bacterium]|nr:serine/threonine protein kinase [bacterium]